MIGIVYEGKVRILAYQEPLKRNFGLGEIYAMFENQLEEAETQEEIIDILKGSGYKAMELKSHASGDFYREDVLKFAEYFEFAPKYNRLDDYGLPVTKGSSRLAEHMAKLNKARPTPEH